MKILSATLVTLVMVSGFARAEEVKKENSQAVYLQDLQNKLDHIARRANQPTSTGSNVAGLRGSKQEPLSKQLYWKGKTADSPVSIEEVKMFRTAVEEARVGKTAEANATLKSFLEKYPKSSLKPDVEETIKVLASLPA